MPENKADHKRKESTGKKLRAAVKGRWRERFGGRQKEAEKPSALKKLKLLIAVVNRRKGEFYADFLQSFEINMQLFAHGEGTASSEMRHMLGLEDEEKVVLFGFVREDRADAALDGLEEKFRTVRGGKGIAYTVPLSSVVGVAIYSFLCNNRMKREEKK